MGEKKKIFRHLNRKTRGTDHSSEDWGQGKKRGQTWAQALSPSQQWRGERTRRRGRKGTPPHRQHPKTPTDEQMNAPITHQTTEKGEQKTERSMSNHSLSKRGRVRGERRGDQNIAPSGTDTRIKGARKNRRTSGKKTRGEKEAGRGNSLLHPDVAEAERMRRESTRGRKGPAKSFSRGKRPMEDHQKKQPKEKEKMWSGPKDRERGEDRDLKMLSTDQSRKQGWYEESLQTPSLPPRPEKTENMIKRETGSGVRKIDIIMERPAMSGQKGNF